jgi:hypothetical protein
VVDVSVKYESTLEIAKPVGRKETKVHTTQNLHATDTAVSSGVYLILLTAVSVYDASAVRDTQPYRTLTQQ